MVSVQEFIRRVQEKKVDPIDHIQSVLDRCRKINEEFHYFNAIDEKQVQEQAKKVSDNPVGKLAGLPVSVKDCICVKGIESRAGSRILSGYHPVFNATVIQKIIDEGGIIIGKTSQDAFGFGSFNVNVGLGFDTPLNPNDKGRVCGGSSGGSGGITVKADFPHISLGESTGGSIVSPAAYCGCAGLCPTYGLVSRYGLMDYGNSLDKIGPMAKTSLDVALMLSVIAGKDRLDSTSLDHPTEDYVHSASEADSLEGFSIGVLNEGFGQGVDDDVRKSARSSVKRIEKLGADIHEVSLPLAAKYGVSAYYLIAMCEASTNLARYCGMRYGASDRIEGSFNDYFSKVRSNNFNEESKRRIILGTFARMAGLRDAYYLKAQKVRTLIIREYKGLFAKHDLLLSPTMPNIAPSFDEVRRMTPLQNYMVDFLTVSPNIAGLPHMSIDMGRSENMPIGMMLIGDHLHESKILAAAHSFEVSR